MDKKERFSIKNWAEADRPREKMLLKGQQSLSDAELLAILIGSGNREDSAVELSKKILARAQNNLHELGKLSVAQLQSIKGIGQAKAVTIMAALELGRRRKASDIMQRKRIKDTFDAAEVFMAQLSDLPHEEFWVMYLNQSNLIIDIQKMSSGGINSSIVDTRLIMKKALENMAVSIILSHNHPSGSIQPSTEDIAITGKLTKSAAFFDIAVLDHIIIGNQEYYSFADHDLMSNLD